MFNKGDTFIIWKWQQRFIFAHSPAATPGKNDTCDIIEHSNVLRCSRRPLQLPWREDGYHIKCTTSSGKRPFCACYSWEYTAGDSDRPGNLHAPLDTCALGTQSRYLPRRARQPT